ncbi:MAG: hypothetical protein P8K11_01150 [Gammaproteobacteria bacterium]|nr:hypothetical protein [Gammaproteobacteria bacterium]
MRIATLETKLLKNGIKEISERYGPSAVILRSSDCREHSALVIGYSEEEKRNLKTSPVRESIETDSDSSNRALEVAEKSAEKPEKEFSEKRSFKDIGDIVKDEIALLSSRNDGRSTNDLFYTESNNFLKREFFEILQETPTSRKLKTVLLQSLTSPQNKLELLDQLKKAILAEIPKPVQIDPSDRLHIIAGGYGVGKSSIALKMATQLSEATGKKASVICFEEGEQKSVKQSPQARVKTLFTNNLDELAELLKRRTSKEIIIVDLAARNAPSGLKVIKRMRSDAKFHLVAPTDSCISSLRDNCKNHLWESLIFTRLDSTSTPWAALEALSEFKIPLSIGSASDKIDKELVLVSGNNIAQRLIEYFDHHITAPEKGMATNASIMPDAAVH